MGGFPHADKLLEGLDGPSEFFEKLTDPNEDRGEVNSEPEIRMSTTVQTSSLGPRPARGREVRINLGGGTGWVVALALALLLIWVFFFGG